VSDINIYQKKNFIVIYRLVSADIIYIYIVFRQACIIMFDGVQGLEASLFTISVSSLQARTYVLVVFGGVRGMEASLFTISVSSLQAHTGCVRWCARVGSQSVHNICILSSGTYWLCLVVCEGWKPVCSQYMYPLFRHVLVVFGGVRGLEASLEADENLDVDDPSLLFQHYLNACPSQGSKTIRTEVGPDNKLTYLCEI